jgi:hypothetical protein
VAERDESLAAPEQELVEALRYRRRLRWAAAAAAGVTLGWILSQLLLRDATLGLDGTAKNYFHLYALLPLGAALLAAGLVCCFPAPNWARSLGVYSAMLALGLVVSWQALRGARVTKAGTKVARYQEQARDAWQSFGEAQHRQDLGGMARWADQYARLMELSADAARGTAREAYYRELANRTRRMADRGIEKARLSRTLAPIVELRPDSVASVAAIDHGLELLGRYERVVTEIDELMAQPTATTEKSDGDPNRRVLGHRVRSLEVDQCRAMVAVLRVLRAEWGHFTLRETRFEFERADAARRFQEQRDAYARATSNLRQAQLELVRGKR